MSCPFYGASIISTGHLIHQGTGFSNRCALITGSHSPCWMEVSEDRSPDWADCPRNPEVYAKHLLIGDADPDAVKLDLRFLRSVASLQRLMRMRTPPPREGDVQ